MFQGQTVSINDGISQRLIAFCRISKVVVRLNEVRLGSYRCDHRLNGFVNFGVNLALHVPKSSAVGSG